MNSAFTNPITPRVVDVYYMSPPAPGIFINAPYSQTYPCAEGRCGDPLVVNVPAGRFFAGSQEEADAAAVAYADAQGAAWIADCGYPSEVFDQDYNCPEGYSGDPVHVHFDAGAFCGPTQAAANALAQAAADAQAAEELVCTPPAPGPGVLRMTARDMTYYPEMFETSRVNDAATAWVGFSHPSGSTPAYWYVTKALDDANPYPGGGVAWAHFVGGDPRKTSSWIEVFSGYPASNPTQSQFPEQIEWAFKLEHPLADPKPPFEGTGPVVIENSTTPHMVGIGQGHLEIGETRSFTLRLENTGESPIVFGTPTLTQPSGEETWSAWVLTTPTIGTINPGDHFDVVLTGHWPGGVSLVVDAYATLRLPNNLMDDVYVDFSLYADVDD